MNINNRRRASHEATRQLTEGGKVDQKVILDPGHTWPSITGAADRVGPLITLFLVVIGASLLALIYGLRIHGVVIFDETLSVIGGRYIDHHFPGALLEARGVFPRGPERLPALLVATSNLLSGRTAVQFEAAHVAFALAYALAAIPTYAMARVLGLGRWWAVAAGALTVCTPLLVFGTTLLNTSPSILTGAIALWAYLRCLLTPGWRTDAVAILTTGLAATARVSYGALGLALLICVVVQAYRDAPGRVAVRRLLRDHQLLLGVAALSLVYLCVHGVVRASGYHGVSATPHLTDIWAHLRTSTGQLAVAYALAPFAIAIAWVVGSTFRPRDRAAGAFATLALVVFVVLAYINESGDLEDRYIVALLPLASVAVVAPFARRELRWLGVGIAGLLVARAVATTQSTQATGFAHFAATTDTWFANVWLGNAEILTGHGTSVTVTVITIGAAVLAIMLALLARRPSPQWHWIGGAVLVITAVIGFSGAWYSASKLVPSLPGLSTNDPTLRTQSFSQAAFVDEHTREPVGVLDYLTHESGLPQQWTAIEMFNARVQATVRVDGQSSGYTCCSYKRGHLVLNIAPNTGAVTIKGGKLPRYLLSAAQWMPGGLVTEPVTTSSVTDPAVSLERTLLPLRAAWTGPGVPPDGWGAPGRTMYLRVFPAAVLSLKRPCLDVALTAPSLPATGTLGVRVGSIRVLVPPGATIIAQVPLARLLARVQDIPIRADRPGYRFDGAVVTVGLSDVGVAACHAQATA